MWLLLRAPFSFEWNPRSVGLKVVKACNWMFSTLIVHLFDGIFPAPTLGLKAFQLDDVAPAEIWILIFFLNFCLNVLHETSTSCFELNVIKRPPIRTWRGDEGVGRVGGAWFQSSASGRRHGSTLRRPIDLRASETDLNRIAFDVVEHSVEGSGFACV